jgi:hypothetical protein
MWMPFPGADLIEINATVFLQRHAINYGTQPTRCLADLVEPGKTTDWLREMVAHGQGDPRRHHRVEQAVIG